MWGLGERGKDTFPNVPTQIVKKKEILTLTGENPIIPKDFGKAYSKIISPFGAIEDYSESYYKLTFAESVEFKNPKLSIKSLLVKKNQLGATYNEYYSIFKQKHMSSGREFVAGPYLTKKIARVLRAVQINNEKGNPKIYHTSNFETLGYRHYATYWCPEMGADLTILDVVKGALTLSFPNDGLEKSRKNHLQKSLEASYFECAFEK